MKLEIPVLIWSIVGCKKKKKIKTHTYNSVVYLNSL